MVFNVNGKYSLRYQCFCKMCNGSYLELMINYKYDNISFYEIFDIINKYSFSVDKDFEVEVIDKNQIVVDSTNFFKSFEILYSF